MSRVRGSLEIARPVEAVFDFVADQSNEPTYNPEMTASVKVTDGPIGVSTRFEASVLSRGKPLPVTVEFTGFDRPRRIDSRNTMPGAIVEGHMQFDPIPTGTRMSWDWTMTMGGLGRLAGPLVAAVGRRKERTIWTNLKNLLEARAASAG